MTDVVKQEKAAKKLAKYLERFIRETMAGNSVSPTQAGVMLDTATDKIHFALGDLAYEVELLSGREIDKKRWPNWAKSQHKSLVQGYSESMVTENMKKAMAEEMKGLTTVEEVEQALRARAVEEHSLMKKLYAAESPKEAYPLKQRLPVVREGYRRLLALKHHILNEECDL